MFRFKKPETPRAALLLFLGNETHEKSGFVSYVSFSLCFDFDPIHTYCPAVNTLLRIRASRGHLNLCPSILFWTTTKILQKLRDVKDKCQFMVHIRFFREVILGDSILFMNTGEVFDLRCQNGLCQKLTQLFFPKPNSCILARLSS
jgi:hypothetical protein